MTTALGIASSLLADNRPSSDDENENDDFCFMDGSDVEVLHGFSCSEEEDEEMDHDDESVQELSDRQEVAVIVEMLQHPAILESKSATESQLIEENSIISADGLCEAVAVTTILPYMEELTDFSELENLNHLPMESHLDILDDFVHARDYDPDAAIQQYYQDISGQQIAVAAQKSTGSKSSRKKQSASSRKGDGSRKSNRSRSESDPNTKKIAQRGEAVDAVHHVQDSFCRNFSCCGLVLNDLHELLQHYEECHVRVMDDEDLLLDVADLQPNVFGDPVIATTTLPNNRRTSDGSTATTNFPPTPVPSPKLTATIQDEFNSPRPYMGESYSAFEDSIIPSIRTQKRHLAETVNATASGLLLNSQQLGATPTMSRLFASPQPLENPLVRRVGDVEDDLSMRYLEMINEEIERDGKRVKLVAEDVLGAHSLATRKSQMKKSGNSMRSQNGKPRIMRGDGQFRGSFSDDDDAVDVVTIESFGHRRSGDHEFSLYPSSSNAKDSAGDVLYAESRDGSVADFDEFDDVDSSFDEKTGRKRELPVFYDEFGQKIEKPYRCTHFGCDKAYKNPNGLKYHMQHGHCEGADEELDFALRFMKPYVCNFQSCYKRYKNLNGLKYHIEKQHQLPKADANQLATQIVKQTNAEYGINARSVPNSVLFAAMKEKEEKERGVLISDKLFESISKAKDLKSGLAAAAAVVSGSSSTSKLGVESSHSKSTIPTMNHTGSHQTLYQQQLPQQSNGISVYSQSGKVPVPLAPKVSSVAGSIMSNHGLLSGLGMQDGASRYSDPTVAEGLTSDQAQSRRRLSATVDAKSDITSSSTATGSSPVTLKQMYHAALQQALKSPAVSQLPTQQQAILMNMLSNANSPNHTMTPQQYVAAIAALTTITRAHSTTPGMPSGTSMASKSGTSAGISGQQNITTAAAGGVTTAQQAVALQAMYSNMAAQKAGGQQNAKLPTNAAAGKTQPLTNTMNVASTLQLLNNPAYLQALAAHGYGDLKSRQQQQQQLSATKPSANQPNVAVSSASTQPNQPQNKTP